MVSNLYLTAMLFFEKIVAMRGVVFINNPSMVDARLPTLQRLDTPALVKGCDRLCPSYYTRAGFVNSSELCTERAIRYVFFVPGQFQFSEIEAPFLSILRRVFDQLTNNEVCPAQTCMAMLIYLVAWRAQARVDRARG
jgi:hypothetical protein